MKISVKQTLMLLILLTGLTVARMPVAQPEASPAVYTASLFNPTSIRIVSGSLSGLVADFKVLDFFAVFYESQQQSGTGYAQLLYEDLLLANTLDKQFFDVYRLSASVLAFNAHMPKEAVDLLEVGAYSLPQWWEMPFLGGYLAYEELGEHQKAAKLMKLASLREGAPPIVAVLAARYIKEESTVDDAIAFLRGLLQTMPKEYQSGIQQRIEAFEHQKQENYVKKLD